MARTDWGIGIVGLGDIANTHLQAYRDAGLTVVGGADINPAQAQSMQERWDLPFVTADWRELIVRPDVRIVDVATTHLLDVRLPIVQHTAEHGKALFVQKPLLPYLDQARQLVEVAERHQAPLMVNQNSIFVPAFRAMEPYLRDGSIGTPYYCQIDNRGWVDPGDHPWFGKDERWLTSVVAVHHFALMNHWFGPWESAYAMMGRDPSQTNIAGDNWSVVNIQFAAGVRACVINNWDYRGPRDRSHRDSREEIIIQGERGCITGDGHGMIVDTVDPPARIEPRFEGTWFPDAFRHSMCHYVDALDADHPYLCSGRDNLNVIGMIEAAYQSAQQRREITRSELL